MTFGSRSKGSRAELEVAAMLEAWWKPFSPDAIFKRVPLSGGWGDADARSKFRSAGDVMTNCSKFPFSVEVKRREGWSWKPLLAGKKSPIWGYWKQATTQAEEMNASPLLWFRKNRERWFVMLRARLLMKQCCFMSAGPQYSSPISAIGRCTRIYDLDDFPLNADGNRKIPGGVLPAIVTAESFLKVPPALWVEVCSAH